jgi:hypothetical protein
LAPNEKAETFFFSPSKNALVSGNWSSAAEADKTSKENNAFFTTSPSYSA